MSMTLADIIRIAESLAPPVLAMGDDPIGLHAGDPSATVEKAAVCLDVTARTLAAARRAGAQAVLCHHPFIYSPLRSVAETGPHSRLLAEVVRSRTAVFSLHTNWDVASGGLNDHLADLLGIRDAAPLQVTRRGKLCKLAVYVPEEALERVRVAMGDAGAGKIGDYSHCSFRAQGTGTFRPLEGASPHIGTVGELEEVAEWKLEAVVLEEDLERVLAAALEAHPYEEAAYDLYELQTPGTAHGVGRVGDLEEPTSLCSFQQSVCAKLGDDTLRCTGEPGRIVRRVALCGGSGGDLVAMAAQSGADVFLTSEVKHHQLIEADALGLAVIDSTHRATETPGMRHFAKRLAESAGDALQVVFVE